MADKTKQESAPVVAAVSKPQVPGDPALEQKIYLVNPAGAIHVVSREHAKWRLRSPGYRKATAAEIAALEAADGFQRFDQPIAAPWSPAAAVDALPE